MAIEKEIARLAEAIEKLTALISNTTPKVENNNATEVITEPKTAKTGVIAPAACPGPAYAANEAMTEKTTTASEKTDTAPTATYDELFNLLIGFAEQLKAKKGDAVVVEFSNKIKKEVYPKYTNLDGSPIKSLEDLKAVSPETRGLVKLDIHKIGSKYEE